VVGIFSDPDNPIGVDKNFHAVHIFKHYKLHVASFCYGRPRFQAWQITKPCRSIVLNARKGTASSQWLEGIKKRAESMPTVPS
jgi:hypothetical protein